MQQKRKSSLLGTIGICAVLSALPVQGQIGAFPHNGSQSEFETYFNAKHAEVSRAIASTPAYAQGFLSEAETQGFYCGFSSREIQGLRNIAVAQGEAGVKARLGNSCYLGNPKQINSSSQSATSSTRKGNSDVGKVLIGGLVVAAIGTTAYLAWKNSQDDTASSGNSTSPPPPPPTTPNPGWATETAVGNGLTYDAAAEAAVVASSDFTGFNISDGGLARHPLSVTNITKAYGYGLSGKGVDVGTIDDGILTSHDDFTGKTDGAVYRLPGGTNDMGNHGTHTGGTIAGAYGNGGSMGVAHGADLYVANISDGLLSSLNWMDTRDVHVMSNSWGLNDTANNVISWRDLERMIINNPNVSNAHEALAVLNTQDITNPDYSAIPSSAQVSFTTNFVNKLDDIQDTAVIVFANSNDQTGSTNAPTFVDDMDQAIPASLPYFHSGLEEAWIAVSNYDFAGSSVNSTADLQRWSQPCGITAEYCLVHDGTYISNATGTGDGDYAAAIGTSMATPQVSGALALLKEAFPNHTPEQLTTRLLGTANNNWFTSDGVRTFTGGIQHSYSNIYGHGIMDLDAALSPIASATVQTSGNIGVNIAYQSSMIDPNSTLYNALNTGLADTNIVFHDVLGGHFSYQGTQLVGTYTKQSDPLKSLSTMFADKDLIDTQVSRNARLSYRQPSAGNLDQRRNLSMSFKTAGGTEVKAVTDSSAANLLGLRSTSASIASMGRAYGTGLSGLGLSQVNGASVNMSGKKDSLRISALRSGQADKTSVFGGFVSQNLTPSKRLTLGYAAGLLQDKGLLGSKLEGALGIKNTQSQVFTGEAAYALSNSLSLLATATVARSQIKGTSASLIGGSKSLTSLGGSLSLVKRAQSRMFDLLRFGVAVPMKTTSGGFSVTTPDSFDYAANAYVYKTRYIDLSEGGTEVRFDAQASKKLGKGLDMIAKGAVRFQPDHNANAETDYQMQLGLRYKF